MYISICMCTCLYFMITARPQCVVLQLDAKSIHTYTMSLRDNKQIYCFFSHLCVCTLHSNKCNNQKTKIVLLSINYKHEKFTLNRSSIIGMHQITDRKK